MINVCTDTLVFAAGGQLGLEKFEFSRDVGSGHFRATGFLSTFPEEGQVAAEVELDFIPTTTLESSPDQRPHFGCETTDGLAFACNRLIHGRGGNYVGNVTIAGLEFAETPGTGGAFWYLATCVLPEGVPISDCRIIELP